MKMHVQLKDGDLHNMTFLHQGGSIVILAPTFAEPNRLMVIPIHTVTSDKE